MRFVIHGAGGIGATIGGRLHQSGHEVVLLARGAHAAALRAKGLTLTSPGETVTLPIATHTHPSEVSWRPDDVVILAMKGQDTEAAARDLVAAAGPDVPVVSAQNGVANERALARWFADVHGICVMCPTEHLEPGVVLAHSAPITGLLDVGRFPTGTNEIDDAISVALRASRFESVARPDIMRWKYRKLFNNLGNAVQALCGDLSDWEAVEPSLQRLEDEATRAVAAAGIDPVTEEEDAARRGSLLQIQDIGEHPRGGGSTWQSLTRGTGVETDWLNGEIALLGRLYGVPTPANARLQTLMRDAEARGAKPGSMTAAALVAELS
jgi:2-dehydropantoate 2-reductase